MQVVCPQSSPIGGFCDAARNFPFLPDPRNRFDTRCGDGFNKPGGTLVCNGVTYTIVSPNHAVTGSVVTANGLPSTSQILLITDKASDFPQRLLTLCTAFPPPPDEPFQAYFFITPVG
jgi:hypothetical protein